MLKSNDIVYLSQTYHSNLYIIGIRIITIREKEWTTEARMSPAIHFVLLLLSPSIFGGNYS